MQKVPSKILQSMAKQNEKTTELNVSVTEAASFYGCDDLNKRAAVLKFKSTQLTLSEWKEAFVMYRITIKRTTE